MKPATSPKPRAVLNSSRAAIAALGILLLIPLTAHAQSNPLASCENPCLADKCVTVRPTLRPCQRKTEFW